MKVLLFAIASLFLISFSGVSSAAVNTCPSTAPAISGHFDNVTIGYDGHVHVSNNGCDYVSTGPIDPVVTVNPDYDDGIGPSAGYDGELKPTGKTTEQFEKYNSSYMATEQDFDNKYNTPQQQQERLCKMYACDASGNLLSEDDKVNPDFKAKILNPVFPRYDESKPLSQNAANFGESIKHLKDYKFSTLSAAYQYRDDLFTSYDKIRLALDKLFPSPNCGWISDPSDPVYTANCAMAKRISEARGNFARQFYNLDNIPEPVTEYLLNRRLGYQAPSNEYFQTMVDPLAVMAGNGQGSDGVNGQNGADGKDGKDGKDGINGRDGKDGVNGLNGRDGIDGKDGQPGEKGEKGDKGERGEKGEVVDNEELARFHHDSVVASGNIIDLLGRIHDAVIGSGSSSSPSGSSPVSPTPPIAPGGSSATPGQSAGRPSGSSDGDDSGLLSEVQGFHHDANENARKLIEALSGQNKTGDDADDSDGVDDSDEINSLNDSAEEFGLLSDKALHDYENLINNVNVPDMDISKGFTDMFKGAGGTCKPFSFEIRIPLYNSRVLAQRVSLDNFCFFWDTYARALLNFSFDIAAFIACYLILMRGIRKYE